MGGMVLLRPYEQLGNSCSWANEFGSMVDNDLCVPPPPPKTAPV